MIARQKLHQITFILAGIYNIAWGIFSSIYPQWLFDFAEMEPLNHPQIFACLGMVIGLYGVLYLEVARVPERGWLLAAIGFIGKILGPIGLGVLIFSGEWPIETIILCLTNDIIWLIPFGMYLYDAWPHFKEDLIK